MPQSRGEDHINDDIQKRLIQHSIIVAVMLYQEEGDIYDEIYI